MWKKRGSPPYTWTTIIGVLKAEIVGEVQLAKRGVDTKLNDSFK